MSWGFLRVGIEGFDKLGGLGPNRRDAIGPLPRFTSKSGCFSTMSVLEYMGKSWWL